MAHSTQRTRAELWAQRGLDLLLGLLGEQVRANCVFPLKPVKPCMASSGAAFDSR